MTRNHIGYLPHELADELRLMARRPPSESDLWFRVTRIAERAYALGYDEGWTRGHTEGWSEAERKAGEASVP